MDAKDALRYAGKYVLLKSLAVLVGLVPAAVGGYYAYAFSVRAGGVATAGTSFYGAVALALGGLFCWQLLTAWALYATLTEAITDDVSETYDTEKVKSDILSVLDSRISDVQNDINQVNRSIQDVTRPDEAFEFDDS